MACAFDIASDIDASPDHDGVEFLDGDGDFAVDFSLVSKAPILNLAVAAFR